MKPHEWVWPDFFAVRTRQLTSQAADEGAGSHDGNAERPAALGSRDEPPKSNKKTDALIAVLIAIIGGCFAGIVRRTMEGVSYYEAISTGALAALGLGGFIFVILTYIRS